MKQIIFSLFLVCSLALAACGKVATETPRITLTPDPCDSQSLPVEVTKVNKLMREFDDYSSLASRTPQAQLAPIISEMQKIRRDAEDQTVPTCLQSLKKLQLVHMNTVIQTLMTFLGSVNVEAINKGIAHSRDAHNQYDVEMARLLGATVISSPTVTPTP